MDCSMPSFPVPHHLPEFAQTHVHLVGGAIQQLILCHPLSSCLPSFPASGSFLMCQLFASGGQSIRASASASVLPMHIQDWFPSEFIDLISLQSKGLSRVFSTPQFKSINSSVLSFLYGPVLTSILTSHISSHITSLVAQLVKNPPTMWETWVRSLGWEDPLGKGIATHSSILTWRIPWGCKELDTTERLSLSPSCNSISGKQTTQSKSGWTI